jgi:micrococcal nuclease
VCRTGARKISPAPAGPRRTVSAVRWIVLVLFLAAVAARAGGVDLPLGADDPRSGGTSKGVVTRVVDGDTIKVGNETVRLIGIDTPETKKPGTPVQCFGKAATALTERLVEGRKVKLVRDVEERDRYGRLLAYVYRRSDGLFVNAELVRRGYASAATFPPNVRHADRFARLAREAREAGRGLWSAC